MYIYVYIIYTYYVHVYSYTSLLSDLSLQYLLAML